MKKLIWYSVVTILLALGISCTMEWSFWKVIFALGVSYGIYSLHSIHPRIAKGLVAIIAIAFVGNWAWSFFERNLPITNAILPFGVKSRDARLAEKMRGPGFSEVKSSFLLNLEKEEKALALKIPQIIGGDTNELNKLTARVEELKKLRRTIDQLFTPPPAPATASIRPTLPGITLEISLTNDQVYAVSDLHQGQNWRYLSFIGAFSHRVDKGDDKACWKLVDNNLPWNADYAGQLQVKAGNTPVKLTVNVVP